MNERDYLIFETIVLTSGLILGAVTFVDGIILNIIFPSIILSCFIVFFAFILAMYIHMKRRILIIENKEIIELHRKDKL